MFETRGGIGPTYSKIDCHVKTSKDSKENLSSNGNILSHPKFGSSLQLVKKYQTPPQS
jgi:hypothetical protein